MVDREEVVVNVALTGAVLDVHVQVQELLDSLELRLVVSHRQHEALGVQFPLDLGRLRRSMEQTIKRAEKVKSKSQTGERVWRRTTCCQKRREKVDPRTLTFRSM